LLATFIIALREGLEAALIVGIIATFLRKNGRGLSTMWIGVTIALLLSLGVGLVLHYTEQALPQNRQELMESIIGLVAVYFVTGMVLWMNTHAHELKKQLESDMVSALGQSSAFALASMAFLAVLKEGFETSVFLLATFSASQSAGWAVAGAVAGLVGSALVGWGIYAGGIRLNLSRFFRATGVFLVLIAAGLIVTALHSAHGAGWLNAGQQRIADLSWLVPPGTIRSALITGVLGIPADPHLVEAAAWAIYIIVVCALIYWPAKWRPSPAHAARFRIITGVSFAVIAALLFTLYPSVKSGMTEAAPLVNADQQPAGEMTLVSSTSTDTRLQIKDVNGQTQTVSVPEDVAATLQQASQQEWQTQFRYALADAPKQMTLDHVMQAYGNRLPVGLKPSQNPGPFDAKWTVNCTVDVVTRYGVLSQVHSKPQVLITLSGSGLMTPRTIASRTAAADSQCGWQTSETWRQNAEQQVHALLAAEDNRQFWQYIIPGLLLILSFSCLFSALRGRKPAVNAGRTVSVGH